MKNNCTCHRKKYLFLPVVVISLDASDGSSQETFHYLQYNPSTNESVVGFVELSNSVKYNTLVDDTHIIISKLGAPRYLCTGSCVCDRIERRTSTTYYLSRGLLRIFVGITFLNVMSSAKEYFSDLCREEFSIDDCNLESIRSEVQDCRFIGEEEEEVFKKKEENVSVKSKDLDIKKFMCVGSCLVNMNLRTQLSRKLAKKFGCEKLKVSGKVKVNFSELDLSEKMWEARNLHARKAFIAKHLQLYCMSNSKKGYWETRRVFKKSTLCSARDKKSDNHSVKCNQL